MLYQTCYQYFLVYHISYSQWQVIIKLKDSFHILLLEIKLRSFNYKNKEIAKKQREFIDAQTVYNTFVTIVASKFMQIHQNLLHLQTKEPKLQTFSKKTLELINLFHTSKPILIFFSQMSLEKFRCNNIYTCDNKSIIIIITNHFVKHLFRHKLLIGILY